ncbi:hypothetical protein [Nocardia sp. CA-119907]|uniref:hypothetical protein n=1 Tax=Nocardia sp. CA-119907 TaxID=3239973 RepID=UPI003D95D25F
MPPRAACRTALPDGRWASPTRTPPRGRVDTGPLALSADADANWLALDLLRVAAAAGEVTELPPGAIYESLDGDGAKWV